jgi:hypothetical protein
VSEESYVAIKDRQSQRGIAPMVKVDAQASHAAKTGAADDDDDDEDSDWE